MFEINKNSRRLYKDEKKQFIDEGYIKSLPVFSKSGAKDLQIWFEEISSRVDPKININFTNMWHKASKSFYNLCHTSVILDYVEDLLEENFYLWGGQFFFKGPRKFYCSLASGCPILAS